MSKSGFWEYVSMKSSREQLIRQRRFHVDEKRRKVGQIQLMIGEFDRMMADLDRDIESEHRKSGISDPKHYAYSTFAKAARTRKENILGSVAGLREQLADAQSAFALAQEELKKVESFDERETVRETHELAANSRVIRRREMAYA
jgi:flagellar protein FliJ